MSNIHYHALNVKPPITEAAQVQIRAKALLIQNLGTVDAYINTHLTVRAGATLQIAPFPEMGYIWDEWTVTFAQGAGTRRLEIGEIQSHNIVC
ncbi:MAG: hypothetical protein KF852_04190 [Saprospiraceae bacterium]|nr:hypothetical protein [Saprospiraceae bacterium]